MVTVYTFGSMEIYLKTCYKIVADLKIQAPLFASYSAYRPCETPFKQFSAISILL